ncbi:MAG: hypothetical protein ORN85_08730, partial [Sediminibacterium sp.]|nr:hypothetical protein [Sediminibacterium sp.]
MNTPKISIFKNFTVATLLVAFIFCGQLIYAQAPRFDSTNKAVLRTGETLIVYGVNVKGLVLKAWPDSMVTTNFSNKVQHGSDTAYSFVIPNNFRNAIYQIFVQSFADTFLRSTFRLMRVYNFDPNQTVLAAFGSLQPNSFDLIKDVVSLTNIIHLAGNRINFGTFLGINKFGAIVFKGLTTYGLNNVPSGNNFVEVVNGGIFAFALKSDGTIVFWGSDTYGGSSFNNVKQGQVVDIDVSFTSGLAVHADGSIAAWTNTVSDIINFPSGNINAVAISAINGVGYVLRSDSTVIAWGYHAAQEYAPPANLKDVVSINAGDGGVVAIKSNGDFVLFANNIVSNTNNAPPAYITKLKSVAVAINGTSMIGYTPDNKLITWGRNQYGQLNLPNYGLRDVIELAVGFGSGIGGFSYFLYNRQAKDTVYSYINNEFNLQNSYSVANIIDTASRNNQGLNLGQIKVPNNFTMEISWSGFNSFNSIRSKEYFFDVLGIQGYYNFATGSINFDYKGNSILGCNSCIYKLFNSGYPINSITNKYNPLKIALSYDRANKILTIYDLVSGQNFPFTNFIMDTVYDKNKLFINENTRLVKGLGEFRLWQNLRSNTVLSYYSNRALSPFALDQDSLYVYHNFTYQPLGVVPDTIYGQIPYSFANLSTWVGARNFGSTLYALNGAQNTRYFFQQTPGNQYLYGSVSTLIPPTDTIQYSLNDGSTWQNATTFSGDLVHWAVNLPTNLSSGTVKIRDVLGIKTFSDFVINVKPVPFKYLDTIWAANTTSSNGNTYQNYNLSSYTGSANSYALENVSGQPNIFISDPSLPILAINPNLATGEYNFIVRATNTVANHANPLKVVRYNLNVVNNSTYISYPYGNYYASPALVASGSFNRIAYQLDSGYFNGLSFDTSTGSFTIQPTVNVGLYRLKIKAYSYHPNISFPIQTVLYDTVQIKVNKPQLTYNNISTNVPFYFPPNSNFKIKPSTFSSGGTKFKLQTSIPIGSIKVDTLTGEISGNAVPSGTYTLNLSIINSTPDTAKASLQLFIANSFDGIFYLRNSQYNIYNDTAIANTNNLSVRNKQGIDLGTLKILGDISFQLSWQNPNIGSNQTANQYFFNLLGLTAVLKTSINDTSYQLTNAAGVNLLAGLSNLFSQGKLAQLGVSYRRRDSALSLYNLNVAPGSAGAAVTVKTYLDTVFNFNRIFFNENTSQINNLGEWRLWNKIVSQNYMYNSQSHPLSNVDHDSLLMYLYKGGQYNQSFDLPNGFIFKNQSTWGGASNNTIQLFTTSQVPANTRYSSSFTTNTQVVGLVSRALPLNSQINISIDNGVNWIVATRNMPDTQYWYATIPGTFRYGQILTAYSDGATFMPLADPYTVKALPFVLAKDSFNISTNLSYTNTNTPLSANTLLPALKIDGSNLQYTIVNGNSNYFSIGAQSGNITVSQNTPVGNYNLVIKAENDLGFVFTYVPINVLGNLKDSAFLFSNRQLIIHNNTANTVNTGLRNSQGLDLGVIKVPNDVSFGLRWDGLNPAAGVDNNIFTVAGFSLAYNGTNYQLSYNGTVIAPNITPGNLIAGQGSVGGLTLGLSYNRSYQTLSVFNISAGQNQVFTVNNLNIDTNFTTNLLGNSETAIDIFNLQEFALWQTVKTSNDFIQYNNYRLSDNQHNGLYLYIPINDFRPTDTGNSYLVTNNYYLKNRSLWSNARTQGAYFKINAATNAANYTYQFAPAAQNLYGKLNSQLPINSQLQYSLDSTNWTTINLASDNLSWKTTLPASFQYGTLNLRVTNSARNLSPYIVNFYPLQLAPFIVNTNIGPLNRDTTFNKTYVPGYNNTYRILNPSAYFNVNSTSGALTVKSNTPTGLYTINVQAQNNRGTFNNVFYVNVPQSSATNLVINYPLSRLRNNDTLISLPFSNQLNTTYNIVQANSNNISIDSIRGQIKLSKLLVAGNYLVTLRSVSNINAINYYQVNITYEVAPLISYNNSVTVPNNVRSFNIYPTEIRTADTNYQMSTTADLNWLVVNPKSGVITVLGNRPAANIFIPIILTNYSPSIKSDTFVINIITNGYTANNQYPNNVISYTNNSLVLQNDINNLANLSSNDKNTQGLNLGALSFAKDFSFEISFDSLVIPSLNTVVNNPSQAASFLSNYFINIAGFNIAYNPLTNDYNVDYTVSNNNIIRLIGLNNYLNLPQNNSFGKIAAGLKLGISYNRNAQLLKIYNLSLDSSNPNFVRNFNISIPSSSDNNRILTNVNSQNNNNVVNYYIKGWNEFRFWSSERSMQDFVRFNNQPLAPTDHNFLLYYLPLNNLPLVFYNDTVPTNEQLSNASTWINANDNRATFVYPTATTLINKSYSKFIYTPTPNNQILWGTFNDVLDENDALYISSDHQQTWIQAQIINNSNYWKITLPNSFAYDTIFIKNKYNNRNFSPFIVNVKPITPPNTRFFFIGPNDTTFAALPVLGYNNTNLLQAINPLPLGLTWVTYNQNKSQFSVKNIVDSNIYQATIKSTNEVATRNNLIKIYTKYYNATYYNHNFIYSPATSIILGAAQVIDSSVAPQFIYDFDPKIKYSFIGTPNNAISINNQTGKIYTNAPQINFGIYTLKIKGQNAEGFDTTNYVVVKSNPLTSLTYNLPNDTLRAIYLTTKTSALPIINSNVTKNVYSIVSANVPTGIRVDSLTGVITVDATVPIGIYPITIKDSSYTNSVTKNLFVKVSPTRPTINYSLSNFTFYLSDTLFLFPANLNKGGANNANLSLTPNNSPFNISPTGIITAKNTLVPGIYNVGAIITNNATDTLNSDTFFISLNIKNYKDSGWYKGNYIALTTNTISSFQSRDYVVLPKLDLSKNNRSFAVETWFKLNSSENTSRTIFNFSPDSPSTQATLYLKYIGTNDLRLSSLAALNGSNVDISFSSILPPGYANQWHHYAVNHYFLLQNNDTLYNTELYLDSVLIYKNILNITTSVRSSYLYNLDGSLNSFTPTLALAISQPLLPVFNYNYLGYSADQNNAVSTVGNYSDFRVWTKNIQQNIQNKLFNTSLLPQTNQLILNIPLIGDNSLFTKFINNNTTLNNNSDLATLNTGNIVVKSINNNGAQYLYDTNNLKIEGTFSGTMQNNDSIQYSFNRGLSWLPARTLRSANYWYALLPHNFKGGYFLIRNTLLTRSFNPIQVSVEPYDFKYVSNKIGLSSVLFNDFVSELPSVGFNGDSSYSYSLGANTSIYITINRLTGRFTINKNIPVGIYNFTVIVTNSKGNANFNITLYKGVELTSFSYPNNNNRYVFGTGLINLSPITVGYSDKFSIDSPVNVPNGIQLNSENGNLTFNLNSLSLGSYAIKIKDTSYFSSLYSTYRFTVVPNSPRISYNSNNINFYVGDSFYLYPQLLDSGGSTYNLSSNITNNYITLNHQGLISVSKSIPSGTYSVNIKITNTAIERPNKDSFIITFNVKNYKDTAWLRSNYITLKNNSSNYDHINSNYIALPTLNLNNTDYTINVLFKGDSIPPINEKSAIFDLGKSLLANDSDRIALLYDKDGIYLYFAGQTNFYSYPLANIDIKNWNQFSLVVSKTGAQTYKYNLYVNKIKLNSIDINITTNINIVFSNSYLGRSVFGLPSSGSYANFNIWKYRFSDDDIIIRFRLTAFADQSLLYYNLPLFNSNSLFNKTINNQTQLPNSTSWIYATPANATVYNYYPDNNNVTYKYDSTSQNLEGSFAASLPNAANISYSINNSNNTNLLRSYYTNNFLETIISPSFKGGLIKINVINGSTRNFTIPINVEPYDLNYSKRSYKIINHVNEKYLIPAPSIGFNGDTNYSYSIISNVPDQITIQPQSGLISINPNVEIGIYNFTVQVLNSIGSDTFNFNLNYAIDTFYNLIANSARQIFTIPVNTNYNIAPNNYTNQSYYFSIDSPIFTPGFYINPNTGVISIDSGVIPGTYGLKINFFSNNINFSLPIIIKVQFNSPKIAYPTNYNSLIHDSIEISPCFFYNGNDTFNTRIRFINNTNPNFIIDSLNGNIYGKRSILPGTYNFKVNVVNSAIGVSDRDSANVSIIVSDFKDTAYFRANYYAQTSLDTLQNNGKFLDYITLPPLDFSKDSIITIETWYKNDRPHPTGPSFSNYIFDFQNYLPLNGISYGTSIGKYRDFFYGNEGNLNLFSLFSRNLINYSLQYNFNIQDVNIFDNWQHYAISFNAKQHLISFYLNGVLLVVGELNIFSNFFKNYTTNYIGRINSTSLSYDQQDYNNYILGQYNTVGRFSDFRIWKKDLVSTEIKARMFNSVDPNHANLYFNLPLSNTYKVYDVNIQNNQLISSKAQSIIAQKQSAAITSNNNNGAKYLYDTNFLKIEGTYRGNLASNDSLFYSYDSVQWNYIPTNAYSNYFSIILPTSFRSGIIRLRSASNQHIFKNINIVGPPKNILYPPNNKINIPSSVSSTVYSGLPTLSFNIDSSYNYFLSNSPNSAFSINNTSGRIAINPTLTPGFYNLTVFVSNDVGFDSVTLRISKGIDSLKGFTYLNNNTNLVFGKSGTTFYPSLSQGNSLKFTLDTFDSPKGIVFNTLNGSIQIPANLPIGYYTLRIKDSGYINEVETTLQFRIVIDKINISSRFEFKKGDSAFIDLKKFTGYQTDYIFNSNQSYFYYTLDSLNGIITGSKQSIVDSFNYNVYILSKNPTRIAIDTIVLKIIVTDFKDTAWFNPANIELSTNLPNQENGDYIQLPKFDFSSLNNGANSAGYTIETWIKTPSSTIENFTNSAKPIFEFNKVSSINQPSLNTLSDFLLYNYSFTPPVFFNLNYGNINSLGSSNNLNYNTWYHHAYVFDINGVKTYINGVLNNSSNTQYLPQDSLVSNYIGLAPSLALSETVSSFVGQLRDFRIWNIARTPAEINASRYINVLPQHANLVLNLPLQTKNSLSKQFVKNGTIQPSNTSLYNNTNGNIIFKSIADTGARYITDSNFMFLQGTYSGSLNVNESIQYKLNNASSWQNVTLVDNYYYAQLPSNFKGGYIFIRRINNSNSVISYQQTISVPVEPYNLNRISKPYRDLDITNDSTYPLSLAINADSNYNFNLDPAIVLNGVSMNTKTGVIYFNNNFLYPAGLAIPISINVSNSSGSATFTDTIYQIKRGLNYSTPLPTIYNNISTKDSVVAQYVSISGKKDVFTSKIINGTITTGSISVSNIGTVIWTSNLSNGLYTIRVYRKNDFIFDSTDVNIFVVYQKPVLNYIANYAEFIIGDSIYLNATNTIKNGATNLKYYLYGNTSPRFYIDSLTGTLGHRPFNTDAYDTAFIRVNNFQTALNADSTMIVYVGRGIKDTAILQNHVIQFSRPNTGDTTSRSSIQFVPLLLDGTGFTIESWFKMDTVVPIPSSLIQATFPNPTLSQRLQYTYTRLFDFSQTYNPAYIGMSAGFVDTNKFEIQLNAVFNGYQLLVFPFSDVRRVLPSYNFKNWNHYAFIYDSVNRRMKFYINSAKIFDSPIYNVLTQYDSAINSVGRKFYLDSRLFNYCYFGRSTHTFDVTPTSGKFSNIKIWKKPLSQTELTRSMSNTDPASFGLLLWLPLTDNSYTPLRTNIYSETLLQNQAQTLISKSLQPSKVISVNNIGAKYVFDSTWQIVRTSLGSFLQPGDSLNYSINNNTPIANFNTPFGYNKINNQFKRGIIYLNTPASSPTNINDSIVVDYPNFSTIFNQADTAVIVRKSYQQNVTGVNTGLIKLPPFSNGFLSVITPSNATIKFDYKAEGYARTTVAKYIFNVFFGATTDSRLAMWTTSNLALNSDSLVIRYDQINYAINFNTIRLVIPNYDIRNWNNYALVISQKTAPRYIQLYINSRLVFNQIVPSSLGADPLLFSGNQMYLGGFNDLSSNGFPAIRSKFNDLQIWTKKFDSTEITRTNSIRLWNEDSLFYYLPLHGDSNNYYLNNTLYWNAANSRLFNYSLYEGGNYDTASYIVNNNSAPNSIYSINQENFYISGSYKDYLAFDDSIQVNISNTNVNQAGWQNVELIPNTNYWRYNVSPNIKGGIIQIRSISNTHKYSNIPLFAPPYNDNNNDITVALSGNGQVYTGMANSYYTLPPVLGPNADSNYSYTPIDADFEECNYTNNQCQYRLDGFRFVVQYNNVSLYPEVKKGAIIWNKNQSVVPKRTIRIAVSNGLSSLTGIYDTVNILVYRKPEFSYAQNINEVIIGDSIDAISPILDSGGYVPIRYGLLKSNSNAFVDSITGILNHNPITTTQADTVWIYVTNLQQSENRDTAIVIYRPRALSDIAILNRRQLQFLVPKTDTTNIQSYVVLPQMDLTGPLTIETWFKLDVVTLWGRVFDFSDSANKVVLACGFRNRADSIFFNFNFGTSSRDNINRDKYIAVPVGTNTLNWNHYAVVYDGISTVRFYLNGQLVATYVTNPYQNGNSTGANDRILKRNFLGRSNYPGDNSTLARYYNFRIWKKALTLNQINLYRQGALDPYTQGLYYWLGLTDDQLYTFNNPVIDQTKLTNLAKTRIAKLLDSSSTILSVGNTGAIYSYDSNFQMLSVRRANALNSSEFIYYNLNATNYNANSNYQFT